MLTNVVCLILPPFQIQIPADCVKYFSPQSVPVRSHPSQQISANFHQTFSVSDLFSLSPPLLVCSSAFE